MTKKKFQGDEINLSPEGNSTMWRKESAQCMRKLAIWIKEVSNIEEKSNKGIETMHKKNQ